MKFLKQSCRNVNATWSNLMLIKNRTCVKNEMGGGGGAKIFDMEFGGVFKIKVLLLEVVSRKS